VFQLKKGVLEKQAAKVLLCKFGVEIFCNEDNRASKSQNKVGSKKDTLSGNSKT